MSGRVDAARAGQRGSAGLRSEFAGWCSDAAVPVECDGVHGDAVAEDVEELAVAAGGVGAAEPAAVVEGPVDGLGVGAPRVKLL